MDAALGAEGFEEFRIGPQRLKAWSLAAGEVRSFFVPHAYRRPWGFVYSGTIGIEIAALRKWLDEHSGGRSGIFCWCFAGYVIANDDVLGSFMLSHGAPVPADLWAGLVKDRILDLPTSLDELIAAYRSNRERLGWLAHPHQKAAWAFLLKWYENPDPDLHIPQMLPDGRII